MANEISERLRKAIAFLKANGYANNDKEIAACLGVGSSAVSMATSGERTPSWDFLLKFSDRYPISFDWLRKGGAHMIKGGREEALLRRIEELETRVGELESAARK